MRAKLRAFRRAIKPWHVYAFLACAAVTIAAVLAGVLVSQRNRRESYIQEDKKTPSDLSKARVNLGYAQYQGSLVGSDGGVAQFLGMRYAAPPTGDRRWRAAVAPETTDTGDQAANTFGPVCLGISAAYPNGGAEDEDCLFVNVWAPANATFKSKLPVWLFIQGGGYTVNSNANWNGTTVVERSGHNVVFVNFNYRVGLWGFLASERLRASGDLNIGLRDQREVMRWIRRNIASFGGDPYYVVIHGASAGAGSVALHLLISYAAPTDSVQDEDNLFLGGIGESVFFPAQPLVADLEWQFDRVLQQTGCDGADNAQDPMACLRSKDTATLQAAANIPSPFPGRPGLPSPLPLFYWTPCVDGDLLPDLPYRLFEQGKFVGVPLLMGATSNEGSVFATNAATSADMTTFLQNNYPNLTSAQAASVVEQYPQAAAVPSHAAWFPSTAAAYGEATFICPTTFVLDASAALFNSTVGGSGEAWGYRYDVYDADNAARGLGVPHIWESWAVFGPDSLAGPGGGPASYYTYAADVVAPVMDYWISFVRELNPSTLRAPGTPAWGAWGNGTAADGGRGRRLLIQAGNLTMETVPLDLQQRCDFWKGLEPATQQKRGL
ncbi:alpha/beta-hydrolase [Hypoxylon crocopeplum]|nr:alpha/beta-hydrolase [Hypoxylon crocopeplum]